MSFLPQVSYFYEKQMVYWKSTLDANALDTNIKNILDAYI